MLEIKELERLNKLYEDMSKTYYRNVSYKYRKQSFENQRRCFAEKYGCETSKIQEQLLAYRKKLRKTEVNNVIEN